MELTVQFTEVDPQYLPPVAAIEGDMRASFSFFQVDGDQRVTRTDFQRARPYDERFSVRLAPLQLLDF